MWKYGRQKGSDYQQERNMNVNIVCDKRQTLKIKISSSWIYFPKLNQLHMFEQINSVQLIMVLVKLADISGNICKLAGVELCQA